MPPLANTRNCRKTSPAQEQLQWIFVEQYFGEEKQWKTPKKLEYSHCLQILCCCQNREHNQH